MNRGGEGTGDGSLFPVLGTENRPLFPLQQNITNHSNEIPQITPTEYHKLLQQNLIKKPGILDITGKMNGAISLINLFENPDSFEGCKSDLNIDNLIYAICRGGWPSALKVKSEKARLK